MSSFVNRVRLPNGTILRKGDPWPRLEETDKPLPVIIGSITVAPKESKDVGDEDETFVEETDACVELWADIPPGSPEDKVKRFLSQGLTFKQSHFVGGPLMGVVVEEIWDLQDAMEAVQDRMGIVVEEEEEEEDLPPGAPPPGQSVAVAVPPSPAG